MESFFGKNKYNINNNDNKNKSQQIGNSQNVPIVKINRSQLQSPLPNVSSSSNVQITQGHSQNILKNNSNLNKSQSSIAANNTNNSYQTQQVKTTSNFYYQQNPIQNSHSSSKSQQQQQQQQQPSNLHESKNHSHHHNQQNNKPTFSHLTSKHSSSSQNDKTLNESNNNINNNSNAKILNLITQNERIPNPNDDVPLFDPEPAREEAETFNHVIILDDKSFIVDDEDLDNEVSNINSKTDKSSISSRDSVHIVNEVPEGRLSKKSSRSSQSSVCSNSTRESSNILADFSDNLSYNTDPAADSMIVDSSLVESEGDGYKNELLETLVRKFNVNIDENNSNPSSIRNRTKNSSDLQKKIQRKQNTHDNTNNENDSQIKNKQTSRQNSEHNKRNYKFRDIKVNCLPQTFQCKYLGKVRCQGLWGVRYTREPIDRLVHAAKCLQSIDDLPSMECLISERGVYIVQKQNPKSNKKHEKIYRSGLIPIGNISYGVQDNKYGKIFSCIVVRERDGKTLCECYAFLNSKAEYARKMALSLTLAFKEYGKLIQIKESNIRRSIQLEDKNNELLRDSVA